MASKSFEIDEVFYFLVKIELSLHCNSRSYVNSALVIKIYLTKKCVDSNCKLDLCLRLFYKTLEIKACRLGSRIRDMEADLIYW